MSKVKNFILITATVLLIAGCEDKFSREWYINHHEEMIAKYTECLLDSTWNIPECQNARDALKHERDKPDVKEGLKTAYAKLDKKIADQPVPDLNLGK